MLSCLERHVYRCINSKRVDLLLGTTITDRGTSSNTKVVRIIKAPQPRVTR